MADPVAPSVALLRRVVRPRALCYYFAINQATPKRRPAYPNRARMRDMLRFVEEIILMLLRDEGGRFVTVPRWSLDYALAGGVLMDLAMEDRIDTDLDGLVLLDDTPTGDHLLDQTLAEIAAGEKHTTRYWVERTAERATEIHEEALNRLVDRGILEREDDRMLWVFRTRRYPLVDGQADREVKLRIMGVLLSDDIPDPRDVMLICLVDACRIFGRLLPRQELDRASERIAQVRQLDLIGQAMTQAIYDIELSVAASAQMYMP